MRVFSALILLVFGFPLTSGAISVTNGTGIDLFGATYYRSQGKATHDGTGAIAIKAGATVEFGTPSLKIGSTREFVYSLDVNELKPTLTSSEFNLAASFNIGLTTSLYLDRDQNGALVGYSSNPFSKIKDKLFKSAGTVIDKTFFERIRKKYSEEAGHVEAELRVGGDIPEEEKKYLAARRPHVNEALPELLFGMFPDAKDVPIISIAGSGGGYRAMLGMLGTLQGAQESGLLDATTYISGVSGSTWALGPWMQTGWSLEDLNARLLPKIETDFFSVSLKNLTKNMVVRRAFKQPVTLVNFYGRMLGANLLADAPGYPDLYLGDQADRIRTGTKPFPIYTAVTTKLPYRWVEFTPFEFGGDALGGFIPISTFGSPFERGVMSSFTPPYNLPFILGICGSAFAARVSQIIEAGRTPENAGDLADIDQDVSEIDQYTSLELKNLTDEAKNAGVIGKLRISTARVLNPTLGMDGGGFPWRQMPIIKPIDAGIAYNFGLEALLRRDSKIIIMFDFSDYTNAPVGSELTKGLKILQEKYSNLPEVDLKAIAPDHVSVFKTAEEGAPVLIYVPARVPENCMSTWCSTLTFKYSKANAQKLINIAKQNMIDAMPFITAELAHILPSKGRAEAAPAPSKSQPKSVPGAAQPSRSRVNAAQEQGDDAEDTEESEDETFTPGAPKESSPINDALDDEE